MLANTGEKLEPIGSLVIHRDIIKEFSLKEIYVDGSQYRLEAWTHR